MSVFEVMLRINPTDNNYSDIGCMSHKEGCLSGASGEPEVVVSITHHLGPRAHAMEWRPGSPVCRKIIYVFTALFDNQRYCML